MRLLLALVLLVVATTATAVYRVRHDAAQWPPDAVIYLRMTLEDRGLSRDAARDAANAFVNATSPDPDTRALTGAHPPAYYIAQFDLFRTRPLYPALAALLYPSAGPRALQIVAAIGYVLATVVLFALLLSYAPAWLAAIGAFAFATAPAVLGVAALGLTDATALLWWIATLTAIVWYARRPSASLLALVGLTSLLLAFTRPAIFLPVGAALGAWFALRGDPARRRAMLALLATTAGVALLFIVYGAIVHGPGLSEQLRWEYAFQLATGDGAAASGFAAWYAHALARIVGEALTYDIYKNGALLVLVLAALGVAALRRRPLVWIAAGSACASLIALIANPIEYVRSVELPLVPLVVTLATAALVVLLRAIVRRSAAAQEARGAGVP